MTVRVKIAGYRGWLVRLGIAIRLMRLAAWIAGVGIQVERIDEGTEAEANGKKET